MAAEGVDGIALLIEEMKADDTERRIQAMHSLQTVAKALGPARTASELVPFLAEQVEDDDEVLMVMAEQLAGFVELMGGHSQAAVLVDILGSLATVEETVVRDKAVESTNTIVEGLPSADIVTHVLPVIERLASGEWFTSRVSAAGLFPTAYARLADPAAATKLRQHFKALCSDDTPMVRRAAAKHIGAFADAAHDGSVGELLPLFTQLAGDDQDSVRLLAIENCTAFARNLAAGDAQSTVLPLAKACAEDKSWRVRNNIAKDFHELSAALGAAIAKDHLLPLFVKLLQDPEAEVRGNAAMQLEGYAALVGSGPFSTLVLPSLKALAGDVAQSVRVATAESVMKVLPSVEKDVARTSMLPLVLQLLRDEAAEVRAKVLGLLEHLVTAVGEDVVDSSLIPVLVSLGSDMQWRVREGVMQQMPLFARVMSAPSFESKLLPMFLAALDDSVASVRVATAASMEGLGSTMGGDWSMAHLAPRLQELFSAAEHFNQRATVVYAVQALARAADHSAVVADLVSVLTAAAQDAVPNVRLVAARAMADVARAIPDDQYASVLKPVLLQLESDSDDDVKHFAAASRAAVE